MTSAGAEKLVSRAIIEATNRPVFIDDTTGTNHAVILTATPSNDGRSIAVRVEPFEGDEVLEVQVLVSPARIVTHDTPATPCTNGAVDPVIAAPHGNTG